MTTLRAECERALKLASRATQLPWHWATSNSTRRLSNEQQDGRVAFGQVHPIDKSGDIAIEPRDMEYSEAACNLAPALATAMLAKLDECERLLETVKALDKDLAWIRVELSSTTASERDRKWADGAIAMLAENADLGMQVCQNAEPPH